VTYLILNVNWSYLSLSFSICFFFFLETSNAEPILNPFYNYDQRTDSLSPGMPRYSHSLNPPMMDNYGISPSVSPQPPYHQNYTNYGVSPSESPKLAYQNYSYMPSTGAAHYNIPPQPLQQPLHQSLQQPLQQPLQQSSQAAANLRVGGVDFNQFRDTNIIDLDTLNVQQLPAIQLPIQQLPIQLPLSDANINMIDSHMFSNLSIHDEDMPNEKESGVSANSNNALPEFPTFSGIFSSTDLDGALDRITSLAKE